jgi:hypothetical protein
MENDDALDNMVKEFVDSELNLIGYNDVPQNSPDMASNVGSKTTDYNVRVGHQQYTDNDLSQIGNFNPQAFMSEDEEKLDSVAEKIYRKVLAKLKHDKEISESSVMEDKLADKKDTSMPEKTDTDILPDNVKRITDLIADLAKEDKALLSKQLRK